MANDMRWAHGGGASVTEPPAVKKEAGMKDERPEAHDYLNYILKSLTTHRFTNAFFPHEDVAAMKVTLEAGFIWDGFVLLEVAAQSTVTIVAPSVDPRIDRVVVNVNSGVVEVITGVEDASPVAPTIPSGKIPVAQIALTTSHTDIANADITDERALAINKPAQEQWNRAELKGTGLTIAGIDFPALTTMQSDQVAFIDQTVKQLKAFSFDGSAWSLDGSGLTLSGIGVPRIAALNTTDIAFFDNSLDQLRVYRFNGSVWSLVGTGLTLSGVSGGLTALNEIDVALFMAGELRTYRWNTGTETWSLVGTGLPIAGTSGSPKLAALNGSDIAFTDLTLGKLRTYHFNGLTWVLIGNELTALSTAPEITALNGTDIIYIDGSAVFVYRWDGSDWVQSKKFTPMPGATGRWALTTLSGSDFAFIDDVLEDLETYRYSFSFRSPNNPAGGAF